MNWRNAAKRAALLYKYVVFKVIIGNNTLFITTQTFVLNDKVTKLCKCWIFYPPHSIVGCEDTANGNKEMST